MAAWHRRAGIILIAFMLTATSALAEVVVIMRREAQSTGKYVRVCDVARVDGPRDQAKEVAMIVLGPSPYRGETQEITRWDIEARLFEMGVDARVTFTGNDLVRVFGDGVSGGRALDENDGLAFKPLYSVTMRDGRDGSEVAGIDVHRRREPIAKPAPHPYESSDRDVFDRAALTGDAKRRVELAVSEFFAGKYRNSRSKRSDIEVEARVLSATGDVPLEAMEVRVVEAVDGKVPGKATLRVKIKDTEKSPFREVSVVADTDVFGNALVAARHISRGELLEERDVMVTRVSMQAGQGYLPPNPSAVSGREAKRSFKPGEPLLASEAVPGDAVKRGGQVVVENKGKGWMVQTKAKALSGGSVGDIVTVEDLTNKTKYQARITAPGTVTAVLKRDAHGIIDKTKNGSY